MDIPSNFEIAYLWVFWLAPLPILIALLLPSFKLKSASIYTVDLSSLEQITNTKARKSALVQKKNFVKLTGLFIIWLLLLTSVSSPQLVGEPEMKIKTSRNFLIIADISFSMSIKDWTIEDKLVSRWDATKDVLHTFIDRRSGDRIGLLFFGSSAYVQSPFTSDLETVDELLEETDVGMAGQMTNIGKAVVKGIELFDNDTIKTKVMLLLTDGVDSGQDILPFDAAELAKKDSIKVYTIGIGDPSLKGSDLDEKTLIEISNITNAKYFCAINTEELEKVYTEIENLEPIEYEEETYKPITVLYHYPLLLAIGLLIALLLVLGLISIFIKIRDKK